MDDKPILVCTSVNDKKIATEIANHLISNKYSPCIHIISNNESIYQWDNSIQVTNEYLLHIKSIKSKFNVIEKSIYDLHPYDIPEVVVIDITHISEKYFKWMIDFINE